MMKRLMLLAAVLAMLAVAAVPALAQRGDRDRDGGGISQESEQDADSGDVNQPFTVTGGGDNSNQCVDIQGVAARLANEGWERGPGFHSLGPLSHP